LTFLDTSKWLYSLVNWCFWTRQNDCIALSTMHSFCCVKPSTHSRRTHTLLDAHNVQNALTSSYCSQNYTAIHLFFHNWRFWTHQNDCIALTAIHSFCCVKPSTHAGLTLRLITNNVQNALTSSYWSQIYTAIHLFFHNWHFWTSQNDCIALSTLHSFCCVKPSTHAGLTLRLTPTMYIMHWHHPTAAKTTLPFIYSFTIDVFGHVKMIV
jgi:hypothetical protein